MTRLSVNINKFATLRNARGANLPDILLTAKNAELFGAEGITVHPRPDERHIKYQDVLDLEKVVKTEFNIEGYPDRRFIDLVKKVKPAQATLVPDGPDVLTSNAGWDTVKHQAFLKEVSTEFRSANVRVSIFVDPNEKMAEKAADCGTDRIELYTEAYAKGFSLHREKAIAPFVKAALAAQQVGLGINAGHDLNLDNLRYFKQNIPNLLEVSIGHALICDAIYFGLENTINMYKRELR